MPLGKWTTRLKVAGMFVHTVYFWLKDELTAEEKQAFRQGLESMQDIKEATGVYIGTPAETDRPVIDRSYDFGLTVLLPDLAAHDAYQVHPLHKAFLENFASCWERVVIYDHA